MKLLAFATIAALSASATAFAQSTATPPNPNNCSAAFPNCASDTEGVNKTPGNTPGTSRNEMRQEDKIPQTAQDPRPMNTFDCPAGQVNCTPNSDTGRSPGPATAPPTGIGR